MTDNPDDSVPDDGWYPGWGIPLSARWAREDYLARQNDGSACEFDSHGCVIHGLPADHARKEHAGG